MSAAKYDLEVDQGEDFSEEFTYEQSNGNPVDLSGATIQGQIRTAYDAVGVVATFTGSLVNASLGQFKITLADTTTAGMSVDASDASADDRDLTEYIYDVEIVYADGSIERILEGSLFLSPEVTKI